MDIVMLALARWDGPYSSTAYSLAKEFSKNHRVFYIDNPFTLKYFIARYRSSEVSKRRKYLIRNKTGFEKINGSKGQLIAVTPGLAMPINFLPPGFIYETLSKINDWIFAKSLKAIFREYEIDKFIFINCFNPFYMRRLPAFFKPGLFVYISVDDIRHSIHISRHGERLENEIVRRADITFTTSTELKLLKAQVSEHVFYLPNAADVTLFGTSLQALAKPEDLANIKEPVVIYTGHVDQRIDIGLLSQVIAATPQYKFLFVGPVSVPKEVLDALTSLPNVVFTGRKDITELPAFLKYASCAIIPFKCNALMKSIYPLKINEYLAAGKPVVSTPFSRDIEHFEEVITLVGDARAFSAGIRESIESDAQEKINSRLKFVEGNTWEARVDSFWKVANQYIDKRVTKVFPGKQEVERISAEGITVSKRIPHWINQEGLKYKSSEDIPVSWIDEINLALDGMISKEPLVSIVIPAWNEEVNVVRTLDSLAKNKVSIPFEIIVVNNNSTDNTQKVLDRLHVRSFQQSEQGCGPARQLGQEMARGKYILMADADCFYPANWIQRMSTELAKDGVACVYGRHSFLADGTWKRLKLFLYECMRDVVIELRHPNRPYLNALGMSMGYVREYGLQIGFIMSNIRGEDGRMCFDLMKFGRLIQVRDRSCRVWTWPRTLEKENNLFVSIVTRTILELSRLNLYFTRPAPHNTKTSANTEPFLLRYLKRYKTFHKKK